MKPPSAHPLRRPSSFIPPLVSVLPPARLRMRQSAGTLLYRQGPQGWEVLLVHPSGNYNRKAPWSMPKGEPDSEEADLEVTARRETQEETGITAGSLVSLGFIIYRKSRKRVHCFAGPAPDGAEPQPTSWEVDQ